MSSSVPTPGDFAARRLDSLIWPPCLSAFLERAGVRSLRPFLDPKGSIGVRSAEQGASPFVLYGMPISYLFAGRPTPIRPLPSIGDMVAQKRQSLIRRPIDFAGSDRANLG